MWWYAKFNLDTNFGHIFFARLFQGIGIACFFVPVNQIVLSGLPPSRLAAASGLSNFFRTLSGGFATAISVTVWDHRAGFHHARLTEYINAFNPSSIDYMSRLQALGLSSDMALGRIDAMINQQSAMLATKELFWGVGLIFFVLVVVVWLAKPPFGSSGGAGGH